MSKTGRPCRGFFFFFFLVLIFETFLGGALWHNVYRGYTVFWGTVIYCSLAKTRLLQQLFVGTTRSGSAPSATCAEHSGKDCDTDKEEGTHQACLDTTPRIVTLTKKREHIRPVLTQRRGL